MSFVCVHDICSYVKFNSSCIEFSFGLRVKGVSSHSGVVSTEQVFFACECHPMHLSNPYAQKGGGTQVREKTTRIRE